MQRQITNTAAGQLGWIGSTYHLHGDIDEWCKAIVAGIKDPSRPKTELPLGEVLDQIRAIAKTPESDAETPELDAESPKSDWEYSVTQFKRSGWLDRLKAIKALIAKRSPPFKHCVNTKTFLELDKCVPVEVQTVYEIDLVHDTVTFLGFRSYKPDAAIGGVSSKRVRDW
jgi:hypothetical protein